MTTHSSILAWRTAWTGEPGRLQSFPSPGDYPNPGIKLQSPALQVGSLPSEPPGRSYDYIKDARLTSFM